MAAPEAATEEDLITQLAAPAADLESRGFRARTVQGRRHPRLTVRNPQFGLLSETIYAGRARDGGTWFWSLGDRIDAIANSQAAAVRIARVLD